MLFSIENDIPIPQDNPAGGRRKYPFDQLAVGESFVVKGKRRNDIAPSILLAKHRTGFEFTTRHEPEGVRVWRTS